MGLPDINLGDAMTYNLAVWQGPMPATAEDALAQYEAMVERLGAGQLEEPTPTIRAYVDALLARWPDIDDEDDNDTPWVTSPLIGEAFGNAIYFPMVWSRCEEASDFAAHLAQQHGLVCFDPQLGNLRPVLAPVASAGVSHTGGRTVWSRLFGR